MSVGAIIPSPNPVLASSLATWDSFSDQVRDGERVAVVHHGDLDGAIGAAYARTALRLRHGRLDIPVHWVATEEYDFEHLRSWLTDQSPDRCCIFDISLANHAATVEFLQGTVRHETFIYDHHVLTGDRPSGKVTLANPTPAALGSDERHVPTFLFARDLAADSDLSFPDWLLLLGIFAEGVDGHYEREARQLFSDCFANGQVRGPLRKAYRRSPLSRIASLVRAEFSDPTKPHRVLDLLGRVAEGHLTELAEFKGELDLELGPEADAISREITANVERWTRRLKSDAAPPGTVVAIPIEERHSVAGPVASVLRGKFPNRVIVTYEIRGETAVVELRTRNDTTLSFPTILAQVAHDVPLKNYGGHPSAAGASMDAAHFPRFLKQLETEVEARMRP